ncbi:deoxyhypusine synthase [Plakobranchus ocellatus]|uniref:Deoxyhypusine synthase n=1 Tax=Plakobranchus ocellatus TaxID=259542 RepID=A0AAV4AGD6_9GAST|nr:deoxyhypusine synthase [Plakobranchus ocellatus]
MSVVPSVAADAALVKSEPMPEGSKEVKGYDFNDGVNYKKLFESYACSGFQATSVGNAITEINRMIDCKLQPIPEDKAKGTNPNPGRPMTNCTIFLSYTSNLVSAGTREVIRYLVQHNMVDCLISSAGGIEEDFIKCLAPTYLGDFALKGRELRLKGINRIGNLLVPNSNYCKFEDWVIPIFDAMLEEQKEQGIVWTPSKLIARLGKEIDNPDSIYYWAYKAVYAVNSGMIILGGGLIKHHTCNANLMRNGADFSVFVNTGNEFDGSDSGARLDEAISWGKIKITASPVKVYADASVIFPILVAESFAGRQKEIEDFNKRMQ